MAEIRAAIIEWNTKTKPYYSFTIYNNDCWHHSTEGDLGSGRAGLEKTLEAWTRETGQNSFLLRQQYDMDETFETEAKVLDVIKQSDGTFFIHEISGPAHKAGKDTSRFVATLKEVVDAIDAEFPALELGPAQEKAASLAPPRVRNFSSARRRPR